MRSKQELARAPASEDPSTFRPSKRRVRLATRYVPAALLLAAACSRLGPASSVKTPVGGAANATTETKTKAAHDGVDQVANGAAAEAKPMEREEAARDDVGRGYTMSDEPAMRPGKEPAAPPPAKEASKLDSNFALRGYALGGGGHGAAASASAAPMAAGHGVAMRKQRVAVAARPAPTSAPLFMAQGTTPPSQDREFNTEAYKNTPDNPFRLVKESPLSTFSVDVDTASYSNMRRFVQEGHLPPADAIRTEEWINYFGYDDAPPTDGEPIAVGSELTECPWASGHELLRVALTTQAIAQAAVPPRNLVFLIDVSGSMEPANKLPLLKRGLAMLARQLRPVDTLSIVVYAGASGLALPPTSGAEQGKILAALDGLESGGSTNGAEGIQLAYRIAEQQMKRGGINRVLLATDGDFNVGVTSEGELTRLIEKERKTGVFLTVLGFGEGNLKDSTMESLADKGNGNYAYIDSLEEARKVLVHEAGATLVTVAQDVKLQLEFNPAHVKGYRLVGYEDRVLADQDFNDDTKDAGDMGAGHHVTAFYEIVPVTGAIPTVAPAIDPLKYQTDRQPAGASASNDLLTVKIRYKAPGGTKSLLMSRAVADHPVPLASTSESLRFGAAVAEYSLALRGAEGVGVAQLPRARSMALGALGPDPRHERHEFIALMDRAAQLPKN
ncbi:MAG TPA: VWA domain-containing protein [Polyangiaceae bacterium]|nr:VWA domain-containing protein [Polyangiaceae bacterium]